MRLGSFFAYTTKILNIDSKEINKLSDDIIKFCVKYIENCSEETLLLNFFDSQEKAGDDFFELTFKLKRMEIVENEFVTKVIQDMWDIGRSSNRSIFKYLRTI